MVDGVSDDVPSSRAAGGVDSGATTVLASSDDQYELVTGEPSVVPVFTDDDAVEPKRAQRYASGQILGAGGMGEVRLDQDSRIGRHVATKRLLTHADSAATRRRFLREARIQGQLEHPAVVPVYDLDFDENDAPFFTMKRVRGQTLSRILEHLERGIEGVVSRFGRRRLLAAFVQVCHAVHYAHVRGVVHRDLKPGNIMLGDFGEVYVLDWGVARVQQDDAGGAAPSTNEVVLDTASGLTRDGDLVGSLGYMAPEQMEAGLSAVDARTDVYALGLVLYELLALSRFRQSGTLPDIVGRVLAGEDVVPSRVAKDVPPELDELVRACTARDPEERLQSAGELAEALERFLEGDRDRQARQKLAREHVARAQARVSGSKGAAEAVVPSDGVAARDGNARVEALREAVRALSLDPENEDAQRLLLELLVEAQGPAPAEAEAEAQRSVDEMRRRGARFAAYGFSAMVGTFPLALWLGIKSWSSILIMSAAGLACAAYAFYASRSDARPVHAYVLAVLVGTLVATTSVLCGPFVVVPSMAAGVAVYFAAHVTRKERRVALTAITLGALLPFGLQALGIGAPAYAFEPGRIVLFERAIRFPETPTLLALMYTNVTFTVLPAIFCGWIYDDLRQLQRRIIVQGWHLSQLFPRMGLRGHESVAGSST
ncbi:MAG: serine/threonine-protein kinase [Polyangiaceae bacterium]